MWMVFFALLCVYERLESLGLQKVNGLLLFEVVPYYLECLDRMGVLFTVFQRENGKHRSFIQH